MAIKLDQNTRRGRALLWLASHLVRLLVGVLGRTWRIRIVCGRSVYDQLIAEPRPVLVSFWHNRVFMAASFLVRRLHRRGVELTLLASQSRDGQLLAGIGDAWGLRIVRGSASRGGTRALWGLYKAIRAGSSPVVAPDGPTGPIYQVKHGVVTLAQTTGTPILPIGFAADRAWRLRSWDRQIVPKPFARVTVTIGELVTLSEPSGDEAKDTALVADKEALRQLLDDLTREAEAGVGGSFPDP